ncbi:MAG: glycosyltransferase, partial [Acidobacteriota bacterium]
MLAIDYVSPLPPVRSGIADYSADLLAAFPDDVELRLVQAPDAPTPPTSLTARAPVVAPDEAGTAGRLALYHMGNNRHHDWVWDLALRRPGVLTLHDLTLHHLLIERTIARDDFPGYVDRMVHEHGWIGGGTAPMARWIGMRDAVRFSLRAHRGLVTSQRGVLTHSTWAAGVLREENPGLRVRAVPMGVPLPAAADIDAGRDFRHRYGLPPETPLIGSFGFQTPMKRTAAVIEALATPELATVHLVVAGEASPGLDLDEVARRVGVVDRVHFLGFLPFSDLEAAIAAVDLCLNLRYPSAGETSASLLRILAVGRPAVVSDYAQYAELPDAGVIKIPVGEG